MTPLKPKKRQELARYGRRGEWVRVVVDRRLGLVRVQWKELASPKISGTESWPDTKENRITAGAYAKGQWDRITAGVNARPSDLTLLEMWQAYADDQFAHLRPRSKAIYTEQFAHWMTYYGEHFIVHRTTIDMVGSFRAALTKRAFKTSTVRGIVDTVKRVYRWAETKDLIQQNKVALYRFKVAKEERTESPDEYTAEEYAKILAQLNPTDGHQWRAFVAWAIVGFQGVRQNAALHLCFPDDVELGHADVNVTSGEVAWVYGRVIWRREWDKMGREWSQPLRPFAQVAIEVALEWRERQKLAGPWLLPPAQPSRNKGDTYDQQSLWWMIRRAEERAGVEHRAWRAGHGARRMVSGDVAAVTGDMLLGLRAIGDKDPKRAVEYIKNREDRMLGAFAQLDGVTASDASRSLSRRPESNRRTLSTSSTASSAANALHRTRNQNEMPPETAAASSTAGMPQPVDVLGDTENE